MFIKVQMESARMDEISDRRRRLFAGAAFSAALFCKGDQAKGESASFSYFSGCDVDGSYLVLKKNGGVLLTHEMNYAEAKLSCYYPVRKLGKEPAKDLKRACGRGTFGGNGSFAMQNCAHSSQKLESGAPGGTGAEGAWKVGFAPGEMPAARYLALKKGAKIALADAGGKIAAVRGMKSAAEVKKISEAARIAKEILGNLAPWKFGTEEKLSAHLKMEALRFGCEISFEPIVATGANSAMPHHKSGKSRLKNFVLVDFGVKKDGYCSDFTRCYFNGKNVVQEKTAYEKCRKIHGEIVKALPGCKTGRGIALLSERLLKKYSLPQLIHSIGHGIGMEVHEYPHLGVKSRDLLDAAVLAIEPAAYYAGKFGVRYEGMVAHVNGKWREL